jgi:Pro-kumamolisin, activation domain/Bacterial Ig-like domain (group 3)
MNAHRGGLRRFLLFFSVSFFLNATGAFGQAVPRVVEAVDNARRVTLTGNVPPLARAEFDRGAVADAQPMTRILLLLKRGDEQEAALQDALAKQQDKSSPSYHQWLTPEEFGTLYGPADADIQAVTQWLESQGFTVEKVYGGKTVIEFSGTAGQVGGAFGTAIRNYQVAGKNYVANASDPQIPAALAPVVAGIVSLNNFPRQSHARVVGVARKIAGKPGLEPLFTFPSPSGSGSFYGLAPGDFATIYNTAPLLNAASKTDGTGQTIAIVGETNINVADVEAFRQMFGLPANFTAANVILNGEDPGVTSTDEEAEADLDTEWSGAVAPGATVNLVVSASTPASQGIDLSALYIIEHNLAGVMSESYGNCEAGLGTAGNAFYNALWEEAAAQGITVMVSAGDGGSAGCDDFKTATTASKGLAVSGIASTPYNVAVGGTDFDQVNKWSTYWSATNNATTGASALSYIPEIPWNQSCAQIGLSGCGTSAPNGSLNIVAGSGGPSSTYGKPEWQMGVTGVPNDSHRDLPDVSLFASPGFDGTGYVYCQSDQTLSGAQTCDISNAGSGILDFGIVGGTSASAPAFAGIMALVNQYQAANGGTNRQGNANFVLYALVKKTGASCTSSATEAAGCVFNDVTHGNSVLPTGGVGVGTNSVPCAGGSPNCSVTVAGSNGVLVEPTSATTEAWTVTAGYDTVTGLGSVNANNLVTKWGTVSTVPTTTTLTLAPTTGITHGTAENVTVNVTVTPTSGTAAGDVSLIAKFANGTTQGLDEFTLASGKVVNATTNSLPGGTAYTVTAHYAGDGTNAPSDSAPVTVTVGTESSQTFIVIPTFNSSGGLVNGNATSVQYGSNYMIQMYVTDKNGVARATGPPSPACYQENALTCPTGTVTLTDGGAALGTGGGGAGIYNLNNGGFTRDLAPNLVGGTHTLAAGYSGDNSFQGSTSATNSFTVTPAPSQTQLVGSPSQALVGQQFQLLAYVTNSVKGGVTPTGTVSFYDGGAALPGTVSYSPAPGTLIASVNTSFSTTGPQAVTVNYSGDSNYSASTSNATTIPSVNSTAISQSESANNINYGQSITVTAKVTSSSKSPAMTGQVQFGGSFANFTGVTTTPGTDASGNQMLTATATATPQATGYINASYAGDANYASGSTTGDLITVNIPDFTLTPTGGVSVVPVAGQAGSGQITITPVSQTPSTVTLSLSPLVISGYNITLSPQQVNLNGSAVTATLSMTPIAAASSSAVRGQTRRAGFIPVERGNWWLLSMASGMGALFLLGIPGRQKRYRTALGLSIVCLLFLALGCGGGAGGTGGGGGGGGGGGAMPTSIALATSNAKVPENTQFTMTATVTSTSNGALTGTVTFYNYGTAIAAPIPLANGRAQAGLGDIDNPGLYQITASYSGDPNNRASTTASPLTQVITGTLPVTIQASTGPDIHTLPAMLGVQ